MGPKSVPITAAYKCWKEAVEDWDDDYNIFEAEMITAKKATKEFHSHLDSLQKEFLKAFKILKEANANYQETFPDINHMKARIKKEFVNVLQNNKHGGSDSEAETELQSIYIETPKPTNVSVSLTNKASRDITVAESEAQKTWIDLQVMLSKNEKFKPAGKLPEDK